MRLISFVVATVLSLASVAAKADTLHFTFQGTEQTGFGGTATGTGSFSFLGSPVNLSKAGLSQFSFTDTLNVTNIGSSTFTYSLSDLTSFSAVLSGDNLIALSLLTGATPGTAGNFAPEYFHVTSLAPGGANTGSSGILTFLGQVSPVTAVTPEPSSFALLGTGLLVVVGKTRKRLA